MTQVVNVKQLRGRKDYVYIGRHKDAGVFHFGNPFTHLPLEKTQAAIQVGTREEAVACYGLWLKGVAYHDLEPSRREWILKSLPKLKDKVLACHCKPLSCHGDILKEMIDGC